jgi:hypothetical protein
LSCKHFRESKKHKKKREKEEKKGEHVLSLICLFLLSRSLSRRLALLGRRGAVFGAILSLDSVGFAVCLASVGHAVLCSVFLCAVFLLLLLATASFRRSLLN